MPLFFISSALLVVGVLAFLLPALLRNRDTDQIDRRQLNVSIARSQLAELEQRLKDGELPAPEFQEERERLESDLAFDIEGSLPSDNKQGGHWMTWPVAFVVPVLAGFVYLTIGTPLALDPANRVSASTATSPAQQPVSDPATQQPPDMREVVVQIKQRLQEQPDDARGWFMLGRAHMTLNEFPQAVEAIRQSYALVGDEPEVLIRLADAIAMSQQGSMGGEPESLLLKALAIQPDNLQGLWLLGMAQSERDDHVAAVATWNRLLPNLQDDPASLQEVNQLIASSQQMIDSGATVAGVQPSSVEPATATSAAEQSPGAPASLQVTVSMQPGIAEGLNPNTALFVYAKAQQGPPMPLAVTRRTLADIPFTVTLSDADAMMPAMKLSGFDRVIVGARLSRSGNAISQPGDIFGEVTDVPSDQSAPVEVKISNVVE